MKQILFLFLWSVMMSSCQSASSVAPSNSDKPNAVEFHQHPGPLFAGAESKKLVSLIVNNNGENSPLQVSGITVYFTADSQTNSLESVSVGFLTGEGEQLFGASNQIKSKKVEIEGLFETVNNEPVFNLNFKAKENADLQATFQIERIELDLGGDQLVESIPTEPHKYRLAKVLRAAGQDNCDTYRIPGLVTTNKGTLIAVYDNRYNNSKDLQEDIDVGMSRSTDGGQTWEPMQVIMDMGEWGGRSQRLNGIGDPSVLYDHTTGTLWVAGLWISGFSENNMLWWTSKPGMKPTETGQFMLVKSTDDGLTWSEPVNITEQIKDPAWQLMFQGPGRGITLNDGTLVFPAQFKADIGEKALDSGQYTSHSTIVYSTDGGESWHIGTGAKPNTTEAQVVQLSDGSLMLNMRDDQNRKDKSETNGRAVATTSDLGKTWTMHPTSNSALQEPNCMASIISADMKVDGEKKRVLFFSNPNNKHQRTNMTIKASVDQGMSWPEEFQLEIYEPAGFGYSCMTMIDDETVGILYEGVKELYFQSIPVSDIIK